MRGDTWTCHKCEGLVPDEEIFLVGNTTGEAIVLHRACVTSLLSPLKRSLALHSQTPRSRRRRPSA